LLLIYAEAKAQSGAAADLTDAVTALNKVRSAAGLPAYSGAVSQPAILKMLKQEDIHCMEEAQVDRYAALRRVEHVPIARAGVFWVQFPRQQTNNDHKALFEEEGLFVGIRRAHQKKSFPQREW
jgi:hypothetical protein